LSLLAGFVNYRCFVHRVVFLRRVSQGSHPVSGLNQLFD